jgi:hypothetical protein
MAANVSLTKEAFIQSLVNLAPVLQRVAGMNVDELVSWWNKNFQGANAFVDADFNSAGACANQPWLSASIVTSAVSTLEILQAAFTQAQRDNLRAIENSPVQI